MRDAEFQERPRQRYPEGDKGDEEVLAEYRNWDLTRQRDRRRRERGKRLRPILWIITIATVGYLGLALYGPTCRRNCPVGPGVGTLVERSERSQAGGVGVGRGGVPVGRARPRNLATSRLSPAADLRLGEARAVRSGVPLSDLARLLS